MSTNTGPDVILMLNDLKQSKRGGKLRENSNELKEMYTLAHRQDTLNSDIFNHDIPEPNANSVYKNKKIVIKRKGTKSVNDFSNQIENISNYSMDKSRKSSQRYSKSK